MARLPRLDDVVRRARRGHDDVDVLGLFHRTLERHGLAAEASGDVLGFLHVAIRDVEFLRAVRDEMLRRQFRHLSRAEDQDARLVERAEDVLRQLDRRIADGHGAPRDARFRAHALSRRNGAVKQRVQHRARRVAFECERVRLLDL